MKRNGQVTSVVLLAAFMAAGCSTPGETPQTAGQESQDSAQAKPAAAPDGLAAFERKDEEASGEDATPKTTGPVSFSDAEAAYHARNYSEAARLFEGYTVQRPGNAWGHFMLGLSAWKAGDPARAEEAFEKALSIDPDHVKSLVNLSRVLLDQNRIEDALDRLTHAGNIAPDSNEVHRLLGRAYHAQGRTADAVEAYHRAIALNERDAWAMNNLGLLFLEQQRAAEAVPLLARAVALRKDVPAFHNNLGMALEHTGRFAAAATAYSGALTADAGYAKARQNLARVQRVKGNDEEPFDVEATAQRSVEDTTISGNETATRR